MIHAFNIEVAEKIGVNEAIIIQNIYFWIEKNKVNNKHYYDNYYWTYNSIKSFEKLFPYFSGRQISYTINNLIKKNIIIKGNYNTMKYDRTMWYAITEKGYSILRNCENPSTKTSNEINESVKPIPDIIPYINTDFKPYNNKTNKKSDDFYFEVKKIYNDYCLNLPKCEKLTDKRKKAIKLFLKQFDLEDFKTICENVNNSDFHCGKNDRGWKANIDWILKETNANKLLELKNCTNKAKSTTTEEEERLLEENKEWIKGFDVDEFFK